MSTIKLTRLIRKRPNHLSHCSGYTRVQIGFIAINENAIDILKNDPLNKKQLLVRHIEGMREVINFEVIR